MWRKAPERAMQRFEEPMDGTQPLKVIKQYGHSNCKITDPLFTNKLPKLVPGENYGPLNTSNGMEKKLLFVFSNMTGHSGIIVNHTCTLNYTPFIVLHLRFQWPHSKEFHKKSRSKLTSEYFFCNRYLNPFKFFSLYILGKFSEIFKRKQNEFTRIDD